MSFIEGIGNTLIIGCLIYSGSTIASLVAKNPLMVVDFPASLIIGVVFTLLYSIKEQKLK